MKLCDSCRSMYIFLVFKPNPNTYVGYVCGEVSPFYERHRLRKFCFVAQALRTMEQECSLASSRRLPVNEEHSRGNVDAQPTV